MKAIFNLLCCMQDGMNFPLDFDPYVGFLHINYEKYFDSKYYYENAKFLGRLECLSYIFFVMSLEYEHEA